MLYFCKQQVKVFKLYNTTHSTRNNISWYQVPDKPENVLLQASTANMRLENSKVFCKDDMIAAQLCQNQNEIVKDPQYGYSKPFKQHKIHNANFVLV